MREFSLTKDRSAINGKYEFQFIGESRRAVVPVLQNRKGAFRIVGTAWYFAHPNYFATAAHLFEGEDILPDDGFAVFFEGHDEPFRLDQKYDIEGLDIAICTLEVAAAEVLGDVNPLAIMNLLPEIGEVVAAFGYAHSLAEHEDVFEDENGELLQQLSFRNKWELGKVLEIHPEGRGFCPGQCYETSVLVEGRDSGAPLFNSNGFVIGCVSSSFEFEEGLPNSTFAGIFQIGTLSIDGTPISELWHKGQRSAFCRRIPDKEQGH